ncbi:MAG: DUF4097 family beta strand repeat-containing protein [Acidobacteriota bacterium]
MKTLRSLVLMSCIGLAASCIMVVDPDQARLWQDGGEFRKTMDLKAGGTVAIEHTLGTVIITGWDKDSVEVVASGRRPAQGDSGGMRVYGAGDYQPSIDVRRGDGIVRILTRSLGGPWTATGLDYSIQVPSSVELKPITLTKGDLAISDVYGRIEAAIPEGSLTVRNFSGSLKAAVGTGKADVELLDVRETDMVDISVKEGDIFLRLEREAAAGIEAEAPEGQITSEYDLGIKLPARSLSGRLGAGGAVIKLKTGRGNIKILKAN